MLEQLNRINLLYDIYAPLLTARRREVLKLYFSDNYSLGEIAQVYDISRQAVHDLIQRTLASLEELEEKLGLYGRFKDQQVLLDEAEELLAGNDLSVENLMRLKNIVADLRLSNEQ